MKNLFDCVKIADYAEDRRIPSDKAWKRERWNSAYLAAKRTNRPVGSRTGPIKEINIFNKEGCGHCCECAKLEQPWDVDLGKWVKSKHWDIRRLRRACSARCHIDSQGETSSKNICQLKGTICLLFHAEEIFQVRHSQVYPRGQPGSQGTWENVTVMEHHLGENTSGHCKKYSRKMINGLTPFQILEKLTSQRKKETKFAGTKDQWWQVSNYIRRFIPIFHDKISCTSELHKVSQARI